MTAPAKKMAILQVTPEALRELLHLPDAAIVVEVRTNWDSRGVLEVKIEGAGWLTSEGSAVQKAEMVTIDTVTFYGGSIPVNWNLPEDTA